MPAKGRHPWKGTQANSPRMLVLLAGDLRAVAA
jgi:hypothetical protein